MAATDKIVKRWRGTREAYNRIKKANMLDYWTRYSVKELNGTWTEYYGSNQITAPTGQFLPVLDIVNTLPTILNPGDRYLVGSGAEWYVVTVDIDTSTPNHLSAHTEPFKNDSGMSVRVINRKSMAYELVGGELVTYDQVDGGNY